MERKSLILSFLTVFAILTVSCSREKTPTYQDGQGGIEFSISSQLTDTKADARDANINVDDFKVELINSSGVIFKRWKKYSDYKNAEDKTVLVNAGLEYTLRATYGDSTGVGFNAFFFMGETTFTVDPQTTKSIDVVCKQANVEVAVVYGPNMADLYSEFHATVKHDRTRDSLQFAMNTTESGYIRPGDLTLYLYVTDKETGVAHRYGTKTPYCALAGDSLTFRVDTQPIPTYELGISVSINSTTEDKTVEIELGSFMLSKDAPKFVSEGFDASGKLSLIEGVTQSSAAVNINAVGEIGACTMAVNSSYLKTLGWPETIDFLNISSEVKTILERDGLIWTNGMSGLKLANIDFKNVAKKIRCTDQSSENTFTITVTDNSANKKKISATYSLIVEPATITISDVADVDVWAHSAPFTLTTNGDPSLVEMMVKPENGSWTENAFTSSVNAGTISATLTGLAAGTKYQVKAAYNDHRSAEKTITTEKVLQVGNSGFEDFYKVESQYTFKWGINYTNDKVVFYPWAQGDEANKWWDTNNAATTLGATTPGYQWAKCFPTVNYTQSNVHGGNKSAEVRSICVNDYNSGATVGDGTPGKLFVNEHAFASRPTKMEFYYKYLSFNSKDTYKATIELKNGASVIATGEFTESNSKSDWTKASVSLNYSDLKKKATSITITFLSSTAEKPSVKSQTLTILGKEYTTVHAGSCITLDDINLVYDK